MVKGALFGLLLLSLVAMWNGRARVTDAYRDRPEAEALRLSGVDLAYRLSEIEPSPYLVPAAPDTRDARPGMEFGPDPVRAPLPVSLRGGDALLEGTVVGPEGPVAGAVVHLERHTSEGIGYLDTTTDEEGHWSLRDMAGGRYRIRAWLPGFLTMGRSEVRYVADDELASFDFSLWGVDSTPTLEFIHGGPMYEGAPATVAVFLGSRSIDATGVVVTNPIPGARIDVRTTAQVQVQGQPFGLTDTQGTARFLLRCVPASFLVPEADVADPLARATSPDVTTGSTVDTGSDARGPGGSLTATAGGQTASFELPGCLPVPEPPVAPAEDGESSDEPQGGSHG